MSGDVWDIDKTYDHLVENRPGSKSGDSLTSKTVSSFTYIESLVRRGRQPKDELHSVSKATTRTISGGIATAISSVLPVLPIIVLFFVNNLLNRLWLVLAFAGLLSLVLVFVLEMDGDKTLVVTTA
jgi:hypothetical protein